MRFSIRDLGRAGEVLRAAARAEVLPRFRNLAATAIRQKSSAIDLVTEADEAAEAAIAAGLARAFPGAAIVGEEAVARDEALLDILADADLAFVVDPIDGTKNYSAGLPLFGVMAAVLCRGEVAAALIHDPIMDDFAFALRGEGAWFEAVDASRTDIRVAPPAEVAAMNGIVSWHFLAEPLRSRLTAALPKVAAAVSYRCAAHEYRMAASGHCHFLLYTKLMPWDHAAGWLLHREAGGYAARFDGSPYRPTHRRGGILCAPDAASWTALREALLGREAFEPG